MGSQEGWVRQTTHCFSLIKDKQDRETECGYRGGGRRKPPWKDIAAALVKLVAT